MVDAALVEGGSISGQLTMADDGAPDYTCVVAYAAVTHERASQFSAAAYTIVPV